jgi:hypothetical protein
LFGKDIAENFVCMLTFCDNDVPPVKKALEDKDSPFVEVKATIQEPWYLEYNNSALYK